MKKAELAAILRDHVKRQLSPTQEERELVSRIYDAAKTSLGKGCLLTGSYARFTASRPLHDLDILFVIGPFDPRNLDPQRVLNALAATLRSGFKNPTQHTLQVSLQSHSVTLSFLQNDEERFAVDIVPAYTAGLINEFGEDIYWVPEILNVSRSRRRAQYEAIAKAKRNEVEWWIKSDPCGYIKAAADLNSKNADFRKVTKFIKRWNHNCKERFEEFKLKSFHIEQRVVGILDEAPSADIADIVFRFFCTLPSAISRARIRDRADRNKFIDDYVNNLTRSEREQIIGARDKFLISLENLGANSAATALLKADAHVRASASEAYLFDSGIPVFIDDNINLRIIAKVLERKGGFRSFVLDSSGTIDVDRKIEFRAQLSGPYEPDLLKWKVKNDNASPEPRGEITDGRTRNDPEHTKYKGSHFVECYAIKDGLCVARARQNVVLGQT